MKKALTVALVAALVLTACQPTPEVSVVARKDTERLIEQAQSESGADISVMDIPGTVVYEQKSADGRMRIAADAVVKTPGVDALPIIEVSVGVFTQEQATEIFNRFFPGQTAKNDLGQVETPEADTPDLPADGTMHNNELNVYDDNYKLRIITADARSIDRTGHLALQSDRSYSERNAVAIDGAAIPEGAKDSLTVSYADALNKCYEFFELAGCARTDFKVSRAYVVDDTGADEVPGENFAYRFYFQRVTGGIPIAALPASDYVSSGSEEHAFTWSYENIRMDVDDEGMANIQWLAPIAIGKTVTDNAALLPFDEIMELGVSMIQVQNEPVVREVYTDMTLDIEISRVELTLLRIRERGGSQADGLLVPVWMFYGSSRLTDKEGGIRYLGGFMDSAELIAAMSGGEGAAQYEGGAPSGEELFEAYMSDRELPPDLLLTVNAIDGSIIDLAKGY